MANDGTDGEEPAPPPPAAAGPTDFTDPLLRQEARRAFIWIGIASLFALVVLLAQPLLVIFGGMVFAMLVDGGARLLGRVLPIGRGWRVAIVLVASAGFLIWTVQFAGEQIAAQAAALPGIIERQSLQALEWLDRQGFAIEAKDIQGWAQQALGGISQLTRAVGGIIGAVTTLLLIVVLGVYFALEPRLYRRGIAWMLPVDQREYFKGTAEQMGHTMRRLLAGRLLGMVVEGIATWILLELYGVPMAALLGLLTGLLAFLPISARRSPAC